MGYRLLGSSMTAPRSVLPHLRPTEFDKGMGAKSEREEETALPETVKSGRTSVGGAPKDRCNMVEPGPAFAGIGQNSGKTMAEVGPISVEIDQIRSIPGNIWF